MIRGHEVAALVKMHPHVPRDVAFAVVLARKHGVKTKDLASLAPRSRHADPAEYQTPKPLQSVEFSIGSPDRNGPPVRKRLRRTDEIQRGIAMESVSLSHINTRTDQTFVKTDREYRRELASLPGICLGGKIDGVGVNRVPIELKNRTRKFGVALYDAVQLHVYMYAMGATRGYLGETLGATCRLTLIPFDKALWTRVCGALSMLRIKFETAPAEVVAAASRIARGDKRVADTLTLSGFLGG